MPAAGKTTLAKAARIKLQSTAIQVEVVDGDEYRKTICADLGFSRDDRAENIRRLAAVAAGFSQQGKVAIISAINPYEDVRQWVSNSYNHVLTVYIQCHLDSLVERDPKGLYKLALLPDGSHGKIYNLTGISDPFEAPLAPDLTIVTSFMEVDSAVEQLVSFIQKEYAAKALQTA